MTSLAVTDHGNLFALKAFHDECRSTHDKYGGLPPIKPILGCEAYVTNTGDYTSRNSKEIRYHLCLHAINKKGYYNLVRLMSEAYVNGFYYHPRIDHSLLEKYSEGLHCSSACLAGEIARAINAGRMDEAERVARWHKDLFGERFSLEVMEHRSRIHPEMNNDVYRRQVEVTRGVIELGKKLDIRIIATNDVHFINEDDNDSHDVLLCLSTGKKLSDPNRMMYTGEEWFKPAEEMAKIFPDHPEFLRNTLEVAEMVEEYNLNSPPIMPKFPIPIEFGTDESYREKFSEDELEKEFKDGAYKRLGGFDKVIRIKFEADYLKSITYEGAKKRWGDPLPENVVTRIDFELDTIKTMGFPGYFLIVHDYINAARTKLGVWVGPGRGSAAGSAVAYALGITNIDPLKFNLLFERFLNPDRISMPDIDVDFDDAGRGKVLDYVVERYGKDRVAHIVTFGQMAPKSAIKDVGRVMEYPLGETSKLASLVPEGKNSFAKALKESEDLRKACEDESNPVVYQLLDRARRLDGCVRQPGVHACGVLISRDPLIETIPIMPTDGEQLLRTQYDGHFVEPVGLLKMDFLGLKTLTVEKECVELLKECRGIDLNPDDIPVDDKLTYELFGRGETTGLLQFESDGMKNNLRLLQPDRLEDLVAMNALYRPGPMAYIPTFIARKHGRETIEYDHPLMEECLKDTYGVTVYQEQVMLLSRLLGKFTRGESDTLRKAMGKKNLALMEELYSKFKEGCLSNPEFMAAPCASTKEKAVQLIDKIWGDWKAFAEYAFNKSHAVCYAWIAYQTGYMKAHYPAEFMCAQISSEIGNFDKLPGFVAEAEAIGLEVLPPDVNASNSRFTPDYNGKAIRYGLAGIKGVGEYAAIAIVQNRKEKGPYKGFMDFCMRLAPQHVNKRVLENLIKSGAMDCFKEHHRAKLFENIEDALRLAASRAKDVSENQMDMFSLLGADDDASDKDLMDVPPWPMAQCFKDERELTGIYLTGHPLGVFKKILPSLATMTIEDFAKVPTRAELYDEVIAECSDPEMADRIVSERTAISARMVGILKSVRLMIPKPDPANPKKSLDHWAFLMIDDGTGETEIPCFSRTYAKYKDVLETLIDKPVLVCGEVSHRLMRDKTKPRSEWEEGDVQIVLNELYSLEKGAASFARSLHVTAHYEDNNLNERIAALKKLVESHPGRVPVVLEIKYANGICVSVELDESMKIALTSDFLFELDKVQRGETYSLKTIKEIYLEAPEKKPWERKG